MDGNHFGSPSYGAYLVSAGKEEEKQAIAGRYLDSALGKCFRYTHQSRYIGKNAALGAPITIGSLIITVSRAVGMVTWPGGG